MDHIHLTDRQFRAAMVRGLGRCELELKTGGDPQRRRKAVLWGCLHNTAFDAQSEGTRAQYMYRLVCCFPDPASFLPPVISAYARTSGRDFHRFDHLSDLLTCFALDGFAEARDALREKYDELYARLLNKRGGGDWYDYTRDNYEGMILRRYVTLRDGKDPLLLMMTDLGRLFRMNRRYSCDFFEWAIQSMMERHEQRARRLLASPPSEDVASFAAGYAEYQREEAAYKAQMAERKTQPNPYCLSLPELLAKCEAGTMAWGEIVRTRSRLTDEERTIIAHTLESMTDPEQQASLLMTLWVNRDYSGNVETLIALAESPQDPPREAARQVLSQTRNEKISAWADAQFAKGERDVTVLCAMLTNEKPEDREGLLAALRALPMDTENHIDWHTITLHIHDLLDRGLCLPDEYLLWVYEYSLCSCCRMAAVRELHRRRRVTPEMAEECLCDSCDDIRALFKRRS